MINIYFASIDVISDNSFFDENYNYLNIVRLDKINRCKNREDKKRSFLVGCLLKYAIGQIGYDYSKCIFEVDDSGYEYIKNIDNIFFSLSHSGEYCVCAVSDNVIGIDIEKIDRFNNRKIELFSNKILSEKELAVIRNVRDADLDKFFSSIWTRKEAYSKKYMKGMAINFKEIETGDNASFVTMNEIEGYTISVCADNIMSENIKFINASELLEAVNE